MNAAEIAAALGAIRMPRQTTRGLTRRAPCPAHDDRHPSLDITETPDGHVLVHCWSGCSQAEVIDALRKRGLWESERRPSRALVNTFPASAFREPTAAPCCFQRPPHHCEHWQRFDRLWVLSELHKNLVEACRELIEKLKRADQPVTPETLRHGIEFAIPFGAIAVPGVDDETVAQASDLTIAEFTRRKHAA